MALIDVVVVNHQTNDLFLACCRSLYKYLGVDFELYGVDNSPENPVGEYKIENKGYGHACNYGASLGNSPYILLLNADTRATADSNTAHIMELFDSDPSIAIIGPKQVSNKGGGTWISSAGCPPCSTNGVGYTIRGWKEPDVGQYTDTIDCMYVAGSVVFTRRDVYEKLGGMLETPLYYEESFYCYLARHSGYRCVYTGESVWYHEWDSAPKSDQHLLSNRPVALESHRMFVKALLKEGVSPHDIPPFC